MRLTEVVVVLYWCYEGSNFLREVISWYYNQYSRYYNVWLCLAWRWSEMKCCLLILFKCVNGSHQGNDVSGRVRQWCRYNTLWAVIKYKILISNNCYQYYQQLAWEMLYVIHNFLFVVGGSRKEAMTTSLLDGLSLGDGTEHYDMGV
jgi:hypothetical protein